MAILDSIRAFIPAAARERVYVVSAALVALLASWGAIDVAVVPQWTALVLATVTLAFAVLHSTSTIRTALYSVLLVTQGVAQVYGIGSDLQWTSIIGLVAAVLGLTFAAAKTPTAIDGEYSNVRDRTYSGDDGSYLS